MPHVNQSNQVKRSGQKNRADIKQSSRPALARDDLRTAFAGDKNRTAAPGKSTNDKSRRLGKDEGKEPVR